jgi:CheY-like chemotaxis protein
LNVSVRWYLIETTDVLSIHKVGMQKCLRTYNSSIVPRVRIDCGITNDNFALYKKGAGSVSTINPVIAVVDDDRGILKGLKRLLDARGFTTKVFQSGEEFLQSDDADNSACVVLDIHMDGMSGIETRRALSARGSRVPVIFMTALETAMIRREALDSGCAAFLEKPISGQILIKAIQSATAV